MVATDVELLVPLKLAFLQVMVLPAASKTWLPSCVAVSWTGAFSLVKAVRAEADEAATAVRAMTGTRARPRTLRLRIILVCSFGFLRLPFRRGRALRPPSPPRRDSKRDSWRSLE